MPGQTQPGSTDQNQPELELTADFSEPAFHPASTHPAATYPAATYPAANNP